MHKEVNEKPIEENNVDWILSSHLFVLERKKNCLYQYLFGAFIACFHWNVPNHEWLPFIILFRHILLFIY